MFSYMFLCFLLVFLSCSYFVQRIFTDGEELYTVFSVPAELYTVLSVPVELYTVFSGPKTGQKPGHKSVQKFGRIRNDLCPNLVKNLVPGTN